MFALIRELGSPAATVSPSAAPETVPDQTVQVVGDSFVLKATSRRAYFEPATPERFDEFTAFAAVAAFTADAAVPLMFIAAVPETIFAGLMLLTPEPSPTKEEAVTTPYTT